MRRLLLILLCLPLAAANYGYYRQITWSASMVSGGPHSGITLLARIPATGSDTHLSTAGPGARIRNSVQWPTGSGIYVPADFTIGNAGSNSCGTNSKFDIESWDNTNGVIWVWVYIENLDSTAMPTLYACYGDGGTATYQGGTQGEAWGSDVISVVHFQNAASGATMYDSSAVNANCTYNSYTAASPGTFIGGAGVNADTATYGGCAFTETAAYATNTGTVLAWAKLWANHCSPSGGLMNTISHYYTGTQEGWEMGCNASGHIYGRWADGTNLHDISGTTSYTWTNWNYYGFAWVNNGTGYVYLNGALDGSGSITSMIPANSQGLALRIDVGVGALDEVEIYNTQKSNDFVLTKYRNQKDQTYLAVGNETPIFSAAAVVTITPVIL